MYDAERSNEAPLCDPDQDLKKEGVMSSRITSEIGCLSINPDEDHRLLRRKRSCRLSSDVIGHGKARMLSLDVLNTMQDSILPNQ